MLLNIDSTEPCNRTSSEATNLPKLFKNKQYYKFYASLILVLAVSFFFVFPVTTPANAATITVTSTADSGAGSLRQVIADAAAGDTITFNLTTPATITLLTPITVSKSLSITGPGINALSISGGSTTQIFRVTAGTLRLSQMTLQNGRMAGQNASGNVPGAVAGLGGAVYIGAGAEMTASNVNFIGNTATGGNGGNSVYSEGFYGGGGGGAGGTGSNPGGFAGGGGGGYAMFAGGNGGYGGGGGGSSGPAGGLGGGGLGGNGGAGWGEAGYSGGGGGAALGGAIYIAVNGALGVQDVTFRANSAQGGNGGSAGTSFGGGGGGGGAGLGSAVFNDGSYCTLSRVTYANNTVAGGAAGTGKTGFGGSPGPAYPGQAVDTSAGIYDRSGNHACDVWYYSPTDLVLSLVSLEENRPSGTLAGTLSATDPDVGDTFTYSLVSGTGSTDNAFFAISGSRLVTNTVLDYETKSTYTVRIRVTDAHNRFYEESFTITIVNVNDPPTNISLSATTVAENQPAGTSIGSLSTTDAEIGQSYGYSLVNPGGACSGPDNAAFSISGDQLRTAVTFDYETRSSYTICIRTTDNGVPSQSFDKPFTIHITDRNDAPTGINLSPSVIPENQPSGTLVGILTTTDADTGQSFTYALASVAGCAGPDNSAFTISGDNLLSAASLDAETKSSYSLCIQTSDNGTPSLAYYAPITVTVADTNDAPTDIQLSQSSLDENQPIGALIGSLSVTDQDAGQSYTYSLTTTAGCSGADNPSFSINRNELRSATIFDYEVQTSYTICIAVMDDGEPALGFAKEFSITVTDVSVAPTGISLSASSVAENQPAGVLVGNLTAAGQDSDQTIDFSLVTTSGCSGIDNGSFAITGSSLRTAVSFDYETKNSYNICIQAADSDIPTLLYTKQFLIAISNINEAPTDILLSGTTIPEGQPVGSLIGNLSTTDVDSEETFIYSLVDTNTCSGPDNSMFAITGDALVTAAVFNFETANTYVICVQTTDSGTPNLGFAKQLFITISDTNDAPTGITLTSTAVAEHQPSGTLVGSLTTMDIDAGQTFTYTLVNPGGGCSGIDNGQFSINGSDLRTAASFDYETQSTFTICIRTTDNGTPNLSLEKQFTIDVTNVNEAPSFTSADTTIFIAETFSTFTVSTLGDPAPLLSISVGTLPGGLTFLDNGDGTAALSGTPARGTGGKYTFTITATNPVASETQVFNLEIDEKAALTSAASTTFAVGISNSFTVTSRGFPLPGLSTTSNLPASVTFKDNHDGTASLDGTPTRADTGVYELIFTANNGIGAAASQAFTLKVENRPVVVRINSVPDTGDGEIVEGERTGTAIQQLLVVFSSDMDPALVTNTSSYILKMDPGITVEVTRVRYDQATRMATLDLNGGQPLSNGAYTLTVRSILADTNGFTLAADFIRHFSIDLDAPVVLYEAIVAYPGEVYITDNATYTNHFTGIAIPFDTDVYNPTGSIDLDDVTNPANYLFIQAGPNRKYDTTTCLSGLAGDDIQIPVGPVSYTNNQGAGPFVARLTLNKNVPLTSGDYLLLICGSTSIVDEAGNALNGGIDSRLRFSIFDPSGEELPETGFAPGIVTAIPKQPDSLDYDKFSNVWLEIPSLNLIAPISGIPALEDGWDLTWLYQQVGWLEGTAFPSWKGNSVLTAHVFNSDGTQGLFYNLKNLVYDQKIIVHAYGYRYTYAVRANQKISPKDTAWVFQHQDRSWLTLLTCEEYDSRSNSYFSRRALRAVLVAVDPEP